MDAGPALADRRVELEGQLGRAFRPHAPIDQRELFRGRLDQVRAVVDTLTSSGQHAVIFGERGVGKTSLSNMIGQLLEENLLGVSRIICSKSESFTSAIRRSLNGLTVSVARRRPGFQEAEDRVASTLAEPFADDQEIAPDAVADLLSQLPPFVVVVVDEFDRLDPRAKASFADLVKSASDRGSAATIVLVGVADDVTTLIEDHASIERCLRQIRVPRMSNDEISEVLEKGFATTDFQLQPPAVSRILTVAQGFPHYAHLLARCAGRAALDGDSLFVGDDAVVQGMIVAVRDAEHSHREAYHKATTGTKKNNLWREVVAACAIAQHDERGFFSSRAVTDALGEIIGRPVIQQTVAFHLGKLTEESRGPLLERTGPERRYRYRFINPLVRPFVIMKSGETGVLAL